MIPFMKLFYGSPSVHLWEDEVGDAHEIVQEEGGEQGDLLTLPFNLGQHSAWMAVNAHLLRGESLFVFGKLCMCYVRQEGSANST